ncbi:MAG: sugar ABC transporter permease [Phototrophicales bacterium]|nr:MAG: sugar ABC transporter permease [Phototrophicales bacterium]
MATISEVQEKRPSSPIAQPSFWESLKKSVRESRLPWLFIFPSALVMAAVTLYPQAYQVYMSLTNFDERHFNPENSPDYVGLENFSQILIEGIPIANYDFFRILAFNLIWTAVNIVFHVSIGISVAMLLNAKGLLGRRIYRAIFVLGWAIPQFVGALVWRNAFDDDYGAINLLAAEINKSFGLSIPNDTRWLINEVPPIDIPGVSWPFDIFEILPLAFYAVLIANIWFGWPFMMVVATGALQSIPKELYEAADVDGASKWKQFWAITVPLIRPAMVPAIMLGTIWTFNAFNVIWFITGGGPSRKTEILVTQSYNLLNITSLPGRFGMAAAFSIVVFFILLLITLINNRITRATESYDEV